MKVTVETGCYYNGRHYSKGQSYEVSAAVYDAIQDHVTIDQDNPYCFEQNGTWYTVYRGNEQVDKFQGKEGLAVYGLTDNE